jgi:hypothetical protein
MSLLSTYASPYNESSTITGDFDDDQSNKKNMINKKRQKRSANKTLKKSNSLADSQKNKISSRVSNMIETLKQHDSYNYDTDDDNDSLEDFQALPHPQSAAIERKDNMDALPNGVGEYDPSTFAKQSGTEEEAQPNPTTETDEPIEGAEFQQLQGGYAEQYTNQFVPYYQNAGNGGTIDKSSSDVNEKLNYLIHLIEEQKDEKTAHVTEELVLYSFLGVFVIYVVDSFARVGKYVR